MVAVQAAFQVLMDTQTSTALPPIFSDPDIKRREIRALIMGLSQGSLWSLHHEELQLSPQPRPLGWLKARLDSVIDVTYLHAHAAVTPAYSEPPEEPAGGGG